MIKRTKSSKTAKRKRTHTTRKKRHSSLAASIENAFIVVLLLVGMLLLFNQVQIMEVSASLDSVSFLEDAGVVTPETAVSLDDVDVTEITSTAMAIASVFPELRTMTTEEEVMESLFPTGAPAYSEELGGITFDEPQGSLTYLVAWYPTIKNDVKQNDPDTWQRYLALAAAPRGISCEYCCSLGAQAVTAEGDSMCGCDHNPALQAITLGLMKYTDYTDAEILREAIRWKILFFPKNMMGLAIEVSGQDPSSLKDLPGMVGGC